MGRFVVEFIVEFPVFFVIVILFRCHVDFKLLVCITLSGSTKPEGLLIRAHCLYWPRTQILSSPLSTVLLVHEPERVPEAITELIARSQF